MTRTILAQCLIIATTVAAGTMLLTNPAMPSTCAVASWYGPGFHNQLTASGERFNQNALTAAHRTLPFGTMLRVWRGDKSVQVEINDRGPYIAGRALDLSRGAAAQLGMLTMGVATVCYERLQ